MELDLSKRILLWR